MNIIQWIIVGIKENTLTTKYTVQVQVLANLIANNARNVKLKFAQNFSLSPNHFQFY